MTTLYGIKNCDTVKKARTWLEARGVAYTFHDLRADGLSKAELSRWVTALGWEALLNKRSTTWRQLDPSQQAGLNQDKAISLMLEHPTLIKRPVLNHAGACHVGFKAADYAALFN